jgi:hypothetical protein
VLVPAFIVSLCLGIFLGRWSVVALVVAGWGVYYAGLAAGWWGNGLGETWGLVLVVLVGVSAAGACVGVGIRRVRHRLT